MKKNFRVYHTKGHKDVLAHDKAHARVKVLYSEPLEITNVKPLKRYIVQAEVISYCYASILAPNKTEALQEAEAMDGGDFITIEDRGDFNILATLTKEDI